MKNKLLSVIVLILIPLAVISFRETKTDFIIPTNEETDLTIKMLDKTTSSVEDLKLEEYLVGVVGAEMPALFEMEALKAQAIASRTFALNKMANNNNFDVDNTKNTQAYNTIEQMQAKWQEKFTKYYERIKEAVNSTKGTYMVYEGKPIKAFYFSMSNGFTESSQNVFQEVLSYVQPVESSWEKDLSNFVQTTSMTAVEVLEKLKISSEDLVITNKLYNDYHRLQSIYINGQKIDGVSFRQALNLRSTDVEISQQDNLVIFTTKGYGHGVGMSQYGANEMAKLGYSFTDILKHYYQNINLANSL